jgi:predicted XRE-type DNA-binding protein
MTGKEIVKSIMEQQNLSNAELAHMVGIKPTAMWDRLNNTNNKDLNVSSLCEMLRVLGYKVQIVPTTKNKADKPNPKDVGTFEVN